MSDETTTAWCAGCQALGEVPTPEHLAEVAASEKRRVAAMRAQSLEDENARLRERVAALEAAEDRADAADATVLSLADALADALLLIHEYGHEGLPAECGMGTCMIGRQLVEAARKRVEDNLSAALSAALAGEGQA